MNKDMSVSIYVNGKEFNDIQNYQSYMKGQFYIDLKEILENKYQQLINGIAKVFDTRDIATTDIDMSIHLGRDGCSIDYQEQSNIPFKEYLEDFKEGNNANT